MEYSSGGDFNGDFNYDLLIGSPHYIQTSINYFRGRATLLYGTKGSNNRVIGTYPLESVPIELGPAIFVGKPDSDAGYSVSTAGYVNNDLKNGSNSKNNYSEILIGAPYWNGIGQAFLIPGNSGLYGTNLALEGSETNPFILSIPFASSDSRIGQQVGKSVGGLYRAPQNPQPSPTVDTDEFSDFVIGAPLGSISAGNLIEGKFIIDQMKTPSPNLIVTQIGVDDVPKPNFVYKVDATTPDKMIIYVLSQANAPGGAFSPVSDIVASSVRVNGIAFSSASVSQSSPKDLNGDGIDDAIVTISPRSKLKLANGSSKLTIVGLTKFDQVWTGTASISVTGGTGPAPTPGAKRMGGGVSYAVNYADPFGAPVNGESSVPTAQTLSKLYWKPISYALAFSQFIPNKFYQMRTGIAFGTASPKNVQSLISARRNLNNHGNPVVNHKSVFLRGANYTKHK